MNLEQLAQDISNLSLKDIDFLNSNVSWFVANERLRIRDTSIKAAGIGEQLKELNDEERAELANLVYSKGEYKVGVKPKSNPGGSPNDDSSDGEG